MQRQDFEFDLPNELIAQYPLSCRSASRLLALSRETGKVKHQLFNDLADFLTPGDLLILNNTRVIPARLFGQKASGGKIELLVERVTDTHDVLAHIRASKAPKPGTRLHFEQQQADVIARADDLFHVRFLSDEPVMDILEDIGHMPLPPYIEREDEQQDRSRYQTVFGEHRGAVAAPTAGLHFDEAFLQKLQDKGVLLDYVTLHVGAGTFQPVRVDDIAEHKMHSEWMSVSAETCEKIAAVKATGHRVIAIGTTAVRCLETAAQSGELKPYTGDTSIFIYPGFRFKVIDALLTNFHLPGSTLMMLVSALAGRENILNAYQAAIEERYRFFSYGDAMLIY